MVAPHPHRLGQFFFFVPTSPRLTVGSQVFTIVEAETANIAEAAHSLPIVSGTMRLRSVLDYEQPVFASKLHHRLHLDGMAVEVDRDDGFRIGPENRVELAAVYGVGSRVHV